jgi:hypothetical protein
MATVYWYWIPLCLFIGTFMGGAVMAIFTGTDEPEPSIAELRARARYKRMRARV